MDSMEQLRVDSGQASCRDGLRMHSRSLIAGLAAALLLPLVAAQPTSSPVSQPASGLRWTVTHVDGTTTQGDLTVISTDTTLRLSRPIRTSQTLAPATLVLLTRDGQRIPGKPAAAPAAAEADSLGWSHPVLGVLTFPLKSIAAVELASAGPRVGVGGTEDVAVLGNGDRVRGVITAVTAENITLSPATGDPVTLAWSSISRLHLADLSGSSVSAAPSGYQVELTDSTAIRSPKIAVDGDKLVLGSAKVPATSVQLIEKLGPEAISLTLLRPSEITKRAYLTVDRSVRFGEIKLPRETNTTRGIEAHAYSKISYALPSGYTQLRLSYALPDDATLGTAVLRVFADDTLVHESKPAQYGKTESLKLNLKDAKTLALEVDFGPSSGVQSRLVIADPVLMK